MADKTKKDAIKSCISQLKQIKSVINKHFREPLKKPFKSFLNEEDHSLIMEFLILSSDIDERLEWIQMCDREYARKEATNG